MREKVRKKAREKERDERDRQTNTDINKKTYLRSSGHEHLPSSISQVATRKAS